MKRAAPLRFLALVVGGWICIRAAILVPGRWAGAEPAAPSASDATPVLLAAAGGTAAHRPPIEQSAKAPPAIFPIRALPYKVRPHQPAPALAVAPLPAFAISGLPSSSGALRLPAGTESPGPASPLALSPPAFAAAARRWSGAAWLLVRRDGGGGPLAPGGTLGGSQAGGRLLYRLNGDPARPLALAARVYAPLSRIDEAEAMVGLDWRPAARLPVHLLAERRQAVGKSGRSAFALTLYGGIERRLPHGLHLSAYGQAGIVGAGARDLFADASTRLTLPAGPVEIGGAFWGAAQPGASRIDAGPQVSYRLPVRGANFRLSADWRFRVAGEAAPGSGPALTLAADF